MAQTPQGPAHEPLAHEPPAHEPRADEPRGDESRADAAPVATGRRRFGRRAILTAVIAIVLLMGVVGLVVNLRGTDEGTDAGSGAATAGASGEPSGSSSTSAAAGPSRGASAAPGASGAGARPSSWPGPGNTGVPAGVTLSAYTGPMEITANGTVIDGKTISGCLEIAAKDVTIRRSKILCDDLMINVEVSRKADARVLVEDSELDGLRKGFAIGYDNYTLRRVNIHNINEGPRIGANVLIEDSWIHGLVFTDPEAHQDLLQTTGGTSSTVRHSSLDAGPVEAGYNAAFQVGAEFPPLTDLLVEGNLMSGGGYTVNIRDDSGMRNVRFRNNTFKREADYGPVTGERNRGVTWESSNVWQDTGKSVV